MNDKELADRVVALGVADPPFHVPAFGANYSFNTEAFSAERLVRDWRVAGALMEKCELITVVAERGPLYIATASFPDHQGKQCDSASSMPRAIIEACVEALTQAMTRAPQAVAADNPE